jgi:hypothetical protein
MIRYFCYNLLVSCVQEHRVKTASGVVSVIVYGDREKPALITYPDLALNRKAKESL